MKYFNKKNTQNKETTKLPMTGKLKKGFRHYCVAVLAVTMVLGTSVTAFAANDPITVVNNLSDFFFQNQIQPNTSCPAVAFTEWMRNVHFNIFFDNFVK